MKNKKRRVPKRASQKKPGLLHAWLKKSAKKRAKRPVHKQVLLHPVTVMVLLCVGVLLAGSTFKGLAADLDVTAIVPAELPTDPAVITDPVDGQHFTSEPVIVSGTCPSGSYVKLYRNNAFSGVVQCDVSLTFQITTNLSVGANILDPKVYNFTGQEGPAGTPITVYYDVTSMPPPAPEDFPAGSSASIPPEGLSVDNVELYDYTRSDVMPTSNSPTITGFAPPFSDITLTYHSEVRTCLTKADNVGYWSCTLDGELEVGVHTVDILAVTPDGRHLRFPQFKIRVIRGMASLKKPAPKNPFVITGEYLYTVKLTNQSFAFSLGITGGTAPYHLTVDWGDGDETGLTQGEANGFKIAHAYKKAGTYVVVVRGSDSDKQTALLQLSAVVKGTTPVAVAGGISGILTGIRQWLWVIWPVYILVVLMVLSFWIGEQEGYRRLVVRRRKIHS
ncbi:MAG TPA: PKD domain-containing protein [Candidatus Saccharimonadales bacterium]|nr:PKD domain-containing protein [Candidatus Saccharimonadales bacterium]